MFRKNLRQHKKLHNQAYQAFDAGDLQTAADKFAQLAKAHPGDAQYRYMLGLAAKYRMDWALSLQANLAAIACAPEFDEAAHWNAAIAATALHDWQTAHPPAGALTAKAAKSWYSTHWNVGGSIRRQLCPNLSPFNGLLNGDYFIPFKIVCRSLSELIN